MSLEALLAPSKRKCCYQEALLDIVLLFLENLFKIVRFYVEILTNSGF